MFTGIIEEIGTIQTMTNNGRSSRIVISAKKILEGLRVGDSINTNGVCLTVTEFSSTSFTADIMPESIQRTSFSKLRIGSKINLERAIKLSDRLGGHLLTGHIDGIGVIKRIRKDENAVWLTIDSHAEILKYIVKKGSIAIDGISLTVIKNDNHCFDVSIIPHTQQETTIPDKKIGDAVNLECDIIGKYVEKMIKNEQGNIDLNFLAENGYI